MRAPKPLDLPAAVAHAFVEDALAYFDEKDHIKRDTIAVKQLHALKQLQGPREKPVRLSDVKAMFREMKGIRHNEKPGTRPG
jgi:hypothetical protein